MNRRLGALLAPLFLFPAACVKAPPVLHPTSVPAPAVPMPPPLTDNAQFGYVRAQRLVQLAERLGATSLVNMGASRGADLRALDPKKPLAVVVGDPGPGGGLDKLPITAVLPLSPGGAMAQRLSAILGPERVTEHQGGVALSVNAPPVKGGGLLDALVGAPLANDLEIYVRVASLMARYGDTVHGAINKIEEEMRKSAQATAMDGGFATAYANWIRSFIDGMEATSYGLAADANSLVLSGITQDKAPAGATLPTSAQSMGDLGRFVAPGDFRFEVLSRNASRWLDLAMSIYQPFFKSDPEGLAEFKQIMATMTKGRYQAAMTMSFTADRVFRGTFISLVDDAEAKFDGARRAIALFDRPSMRQLFAKGGLEMRFTTRKAVRQIETWPVDQVTYEFKFNQANKVPELERLFTKPMEIEMMRIGSYLVYVFNEAPGTLDKVVADMLSGTGPYPSLSARAEQPAGGYLYGDIDVAHMLESVRGIVKESKRDEVPRLDPAMPRVTLFAYDGGPTTWYKTNVPLRLIDAIRDIATRAGKNDGAYLPAPKD